MLNKIPNKSDFLHRTLGRMRAKGTSLPLELMEIFTGDDAPTRDAKKATQPTFEMGVQHFHSKDFSLAQECFEQVLQKHPSDSVAAFYLRETLKLVLSEVPKDWDGSIRMEAK
jgi:TolA-binding protein